MATLINGKWYGNVRVDYTRHRRAFKTEEEALAFEQNPYLLLGRELAVISIVWPAWAREIWGKTRNERNALRITDELIVRLGKTTTVKSIDRQAIKRLIEELKSQGNAANTINTKLACLSKLMRHAVKEDIIETAPTFEAQRVPRGRIRSLSFEEEDKMRGEMPEKMQHYFNFLLYTGCRVSEALKLEWSDVDGDAATFWRTKTDRPRTVPLASPALAALAYARSEGWSRPFAGIEYAPFRMAFRRAKAKAGLADDSQVTPHVLRHTCATRLGKAKMDPLRMKDWLGHATLQMTSRYTHLDVSDLRQGAAALERR